MENGEFNGVCPEQTRANAARRGFVRPRYFTGLIITPSIANGRSGTRRVIKKLELLSSPLNLIPTISSLNASNNI